jgi:hypothetical protein
MRFTNNHLELLIEEVAKAITSKEDEVFVYVGNNSYVLDQDGLREAIREALENA